MECKICKSKQINLIYSGKIRSGSFGKLTSDSHDIFECTKCKTIFLDNSNSSDFYESKEYRSMYNNSPEFDTYYKLHDELDNQKIYKIGIQNLRNKVVVDSGAGAGTFIDIASSVAAKTYAIEPSKLFQKKLIEKHEVYSYGKDLIKSNIKVDVATSFDVIEHVEDPLNYLKEAFEYLNSGGKLYLLTPNFDDILNDMVKEDFELFNYRTAHLYYFSYESIKYILSKAGFKKFKISYYHKQDLSNLLFWLKDRKPTGKLKYSFFDKEFNDIYSKYIENKGKASHLWVEVTK